MSTEYPQYPQYPQYPPVTFIEMLEEIYATSDEPEGPMIRHEHDPDGMVSVFQGDRELFRCSVDRHRLLLAVLDLEAREYVPHNEPS